jgi:RNA polymerase sigma-70 factor (ECF subfamily)
MAVSSIHTAQISRWLDRIAAGDRAAQDELLAAVSGRLLRLARKMFRHFPRVRRWVDSDDVLQNAQLRLLRALETVRPDSARAFFALAAQQIRRELLDMARHFFGPQGLGANHDSQPPASARPPVPDRKDDSGDLTRWQAFHESVAQLPPEEREVVDLLYYAGQTQAEAAELLGVAVRTVQRRWGAALLRLHGDLRVD